MPFRVFIGARGCGKTFSALRNATVSDGAIIYPPSQYEGKFLYVRRSQKEIDISTSSVGNPFKRINAVYNVDIRPSRNRALGVTEFTAPDRSGQMDATGKNMLRETIGYGAALSTFGNVRGIDFSDVDTIIFDEFIGQRTSRPIKGEGNAFLHMYETIARNRELEGRPPLTAILLANAITLDSEILLAMHATSQLAHMLSRGQYRATLRERSLYLEVVVKQDFHDLKSETALYKLAGDGSEFTREALENQFTQDDMSMVRKQVRINEYRPIITVGEEFTIYKHKSRYEYYASGKTRMRSPVTYNASSIDRFRHYFDLVYSDAIITRRIYFDDYSVKLIMDSLLLK